MPDENVHRMWSDDDLDTALATLRSDVDTGDLGAARAALLRAADPTATAPPAPSRPHWSRWAAAAAAVAVLVAGVFALQQGRARDDLPHPPATTHKQDVVNRIGAVDAPQRPGQFRYIDTHLWGIAQSEKYAYLAEVRTETWMPEQVRADWLQRRSVSGKRKWIFGNEADAKQDGGLHMWTGGTWHAPCGSFGQETSFARCDAKGSWDEPSTKFLAALPRDPRKLYDLLRADTDDSYWLLYRVTTVLRGGTVPADLRRALYRALAKSPDIRVTEGVANVDGRTGISFSAVGDATVDEIFVDPATGLFIGERRTTTFAEMGVPKGAVIADSAVSYAVVDRQGAEPAR